MNERLRKLRKVLDMTQQEFADKIGSKRNTIAKYETDANTPSAAVISLICREFDVNEEWLRNGTGEMFMERDPDEELLGWAGKVLLNETDTFKIRFLKMLSGLSDDDWSLLESKLREIFEERP